MKIYYAMNNNAPNHIISYCVKAGVDFVDFVELIAKKM